MWTRKPLFGFAVGALALMLTAPVVAASPSERSEMPRRGPDTHVPTDGRPIVATVIEIDEAAGTVTLETPHGPVALSVTPDLVERLSVGDVVVVRFTDDDDQDSPSASPREAPAPGSSRI
jgi:hypothetical protein